MMLALLIALTLGIVLLPMIPALREWSRPTDVVPLHIDDDDALDPPYLARRFMQELTQAVDAGAGELGGSKIACVEATQADLPLSDFERAKRRSQRLWHAAGAAELPEGVAFQGEVVAHGALRSAARGAYRALWSGARLSLLPGGRVQRWAHGMEVLVGKDCRVPGRVSADRSIVVEHSVQFGLLHAPEIRFADLPGTPMRAFNTRVVGVAHTGLSNPMQWDVNELRAVCTHSAQVEPLHSWRGDLVCHGDLSLGSQCHARGSLKAHGSLELGPGCHVTGSVFAQGEIRLGAGCVVHGHVVSETAVLLAPGCVVGWMSQPATVAAPHIDVGPAVRVHGTLWAATMGRSWFAFDHERMPALAQVAA